MQKHHLPLRHAAPLTMAMLAFVTAPAFAQAHGAHGAKMPTTGYRAELIRDIEQLESKFMGLATAMSGKYTWRPADGVRSVSEVYMHTAAGNFMLLTMAGVMAPEDIKAGSQAEMMATMQKLEQMTDEAKIQETLKRSFTHAKHGIAMVPDDQLDAKTQLFGQEATKRAVLHLLVTHMHEHLGQSIAYARANKVTPPWSGGGSN